MNSKPAKKICVLSSVHPVDDIRIFHKEIRSLSKAGYAVTLIALPPQGSIDAICGLTKVIELKVSANKFSRILLSPLKLLILSLKQKAHIYHFHDPELIPVGLCLKLCGKKVIYDVHEDYTKSILSKQYLNRFLKSIISLSFHFIEKCSAPFFDLIITATDKIQMNFPNVRSTSVHNYPLLQSITKPNNVSESFKIIYPGPISNIRGITNVFEALDRLDILNIELILIGEFVPASYKDFLMKFKSWGKVSYRGVVSHEEVIRSIASADLGIECSLPEPNYLYAESNKIFEYMSVGIPVLCSNLPRIKEIVEGSECGLCVAANPDDIAKSILYLYERPELMAQMGKNGRNAVVNMYNWEVESIKLLKSYQNLL